MTTPELLVDRREGVLTLTLYRPDKLNALTRAMVAEAVDRLREASHDPEVGCVVVTGAGRGFCSGGDVGVMGRSGPRPSSFEARVDRQRASHELPRLLWEMPKVTVAAVNGAAVGAGLGIALACDLCVAAEGATLATGFAKVGLGGDFGVSWQLARKVGPGRAKELLFLAEQLSAEEAAALGLVNRVVPPSAFRAEVDALARRLAEGPPVGYRYLKQNVNEAMSCDFATALAREASTHVRSAQTADHREGVAALVERRPPRFTGS